MHSEGAGGAGEGGGPLLAVGKQTDGRMSQTVYAFVPRKFYQSIADRIHLSGATCTSNKS